MSVGADTTAGPRKIEWTPEEFGTVKGTLIPLQSIWDKSGNLWGLRTW